MDLQLNKLGPECLCLKINPTTNRRERAQENLEIRKIVIIDLTLNLPSQSPFCKITLKLVSLSMWPWY